MLFRSENDQGCIFGADSAYIGKRCEKIILENEMINQVNERAYRNQKLTKKQKRKNKKKSRIRARVEHVFGYMEQSMEKLYLKYIGLNRIGNTIGMINLVYNLFRYEQIKRLGIS